MLHIFLHAKKVAKLEINFRAILSPIKKTHDVLSCRDGCSGGFSSGHCFALAATGCGINIDIYQQLIPY